MLAPLIGKNIALLNLRVLASTAFAIFASAMFWMSHLNDQASYAQLAAPRLWQGLAIPDVLCC